MLKIVYVAASDARAEADIAEPLENYLRAAYLANSADRISESGDSLLDTAAFKERAMIYGSPDTVASQIQTYVDVGVTGMMLWLTWGSNDPDRVRRSMRLFVDAVMPRFAHSCTSSSSRSTSC